MNPAREPDRLRPSSPRRRASLPSRQRPTWTLLLAWPLAFPAFGAAPPSATAPAAAVGVSSSTVVITLPEGAAAGTAAAAEAVTASLAAASARDVLRVRSVKGDRPSGFGTMVVASFEEPAALERWRAGQVRGVPLAVRSVGTLAGGGTGAPATSRSVFKISYYTLTAPLDAFRAWVDGYLAKYLESQRAAGILTSYRMYLEEGEGGRALLVLEYPDAAVEQASEARKEKLSEELAARDAEYARQHALKETLRRTDSWTLATPFE